MNLITHIEIPGSTADNAAIGLVNGMLRWSSAPKVSYTVGIIDEATVSGVDYECNIALGGTLGGPQGQVTINAFNSTLQGMLFNNTLNLIGAVVRVYVQPEGFDPMLRFTGRVSSWATLDEVTTEITCETSSILDVIKVPGTTITSEMALGNQDSEAIGKPVETAYGAVCDFPLVLLPTERNTYAMLNYPSLDATEFTTLPWTLYAEASAPPYGQTGDPMQTFAPSKKFIPKTLMQCLGKFQPAAGDHVWIALSSTGHMLFNSEAEAHIDTIRNAFVGLQLYVARGTGEGQSYTILDAQYTMHDPGEGLIETVWFKTSSKNAGDFASSNGFDGSYESDDAQNHNYNFRSYWEQLWDDTDPRLVAAYDGGKVRNDVSFFVLAAAGNTFIVSSEARTDIACSLIDSKTGAVVDIDAGALVTLFEGEGWKTVRLLTAGILASDEDSSYSQNTGVPITARFNEPASMQYDINNSGAIASVNGVPIAPLSDGVTDTQIISPIGVTTSQTITPVGSWNGGYGVAMEYSYYVQLADRIDDNDLTRDGYSVSLLPHASFEWRSGSLATATHTNKIVNFRLQIDIVAVSEGNLVLGGVNSEDVYSFNTYSTATNAQWGGKVVINPEASAIEFYGIPSNTELMNYLGESIAGGGISCKPAYEKLRKSLDVTQLLKVPSIENVKYLQVRMIMQAKEPGDDMSIVFDAPSTLTKIIYSPYLCYTRSVEKDNLYLRTERADSTGVDRPSELIRQIASASGLVINDASFDAAATVSASLASSDISISARVGTTISELITRIASQSQLAVYTNHAAELACRFMGDTNYSATPDFTFTGALVKAKSMRVSKPRGGYLSSDFTFSFRPKTYSDTTHLFVNTNLAAFPGPFDREVFGPVYTQGVGVSMRLFPQNGISDFQLLRVRMDASVGNPMLLFVVGSYFKLVTDLGTFPLCRVVSVAPDTLSDASQYGAHVELQIFGGPTWIGTEAPVSLQAVAPEYAWRQAVSGSMVDDYTTALNLWEQAKAARLLLGVESPLLPEFTTIEDPLYGTSDNAMRQYALYTVLWATREKTVITFTAPMTQYTLQVGLMNWVEFAWGPFTSNPIKGFVTVAQDDYAKGEIKFTLLCPRPADDILTILNENYAAADLTVNETEAGTPGLYNEGLLA